MLIRGICWALGVLLLMALPARADSQNLNTYAEQTLVVPGFEAGTTHALRVLLPPGYAAQIRQRYPLLMVNDGQDARAVDLAGILARLQREGRMAPVIAVAVPMLPDRMATYGFSSRADGISLPAETRYGPVGGQAHAYSEWLVQTVLPVIDANLRTRAEPAHRAILGWSLGAANAFSVAWNYPEAFGQVGAFSPSFWLSRSAGAPETAIAPYLMTLPHKPATFRAYIAVGSKEETDDRDGDGVIDAVDDAQTVFAALVARYGSANTGAPANALHFELLPDGQHNQDSWKKMLPGFLQWAFPAPVRPRLPKVSAGRIERYPEFASRFVPAHAVDVWLPPGYSERRRYAVLYMHDGQMLFDADQTWNKQAWRADQTASRLMAEGKVRPFIIVAVHNGGSNRHSEYFPQKPFESLPAAEQNAVMLARRTAQTALFSAPIASDAYLRFLTQELKPFIDRRYAVNTGPADTVILGSSMGGLISWYALAEYPQVFGAAGAMSTHWPGLMPTTPDYVADSNPVPDAFFRYMAEHLPDPETHRLYFDYGTATLDANYPVLQARADAVLQARGYGPKHWQTVRFEGAEHSEAAWADRFSIPLQFLLAPEH